MKNTNKIFNKKIHVIFAIFTLILSFGISFTNVNASYDVDHDNDGNYETYQNYFSFRINYDDGSYQLKKYYFNSYSKVELTDNSLTVYFDFYPNSTNFREIYSSDGKLENVYIYPSEINQKNTATIYYIREEISDIVTDCETLANDIKALGDSPVIPEYIPPKGAVEESLSQVNLIPEIVIIVGSTICLVGFLLGLRVLLKGLRTVSRG